MPISARVREFPGSGPPGARDEETRLTRENRVLRSIVVVAVLLIGPLVTAGYFWGRFTAPTVAPEPARASEPPARPIAPPAAAQPVAATAAREERPVRSATYLQVAATTEHQEVIERLRRNGFPAVTAEVPGSPDRRRVLVGPLAAGEVSTMRASLQEKGFPGKAAIRRKIAGR